MPLRKRLKPVDAKNPDEIRMTLGEHLEELRSRLIRALVALVIGAIICYSFIDYVLAFLVWPIFTIYRKHGFSETALKTLSPAEGFMTTLKVAIIVGVIISAPYSIAQIWGFVAAGLYPHERRWVRLFAPASIALFFIGALFLIIVVSPVLLDFLLTYQTELPNIEWAMPSFLVKATQPEPMEIEYSPPGFGTATQPAGHLPALPAYAQDPKNPPEGVLWLNRTEREIRIRLGGKTFTCSNLKELGAKNRIVPDMRLGEVVPFVLQMAAAFGLGFQVPIVVAFLALVGIFSSSDMAHYRRHVIFIMAVLAAVVTPPDPGSMVMLLLPMVGLFEAGLVAARIIERRRAAANAGH